MKYGVAVLVVLGMFLCGPLRETAWSQAGVQAPAGEAAQKQNPGSAVTAAPDPRVKDPAQLAEALKKAQKGAQPPQPAARPEAAGSAAAPAAAPTGKNEAEIEDLKARFRKLVDSEMKKFGALEEQLPAEAEKPAGAAQAQAGANGKAPQAAGRTAAPGAVKPGETEGAPAAKAVSPGGAPEAPAPAAEEAAPEEKIKGDKPIAPVAIEKVPDPAGENEGAEEAGEEEEEPLEGVEEEKPPERVEVLPPQPQKPAEGKQKVALDFQDAELQEVITALAEIVGINYIVDPKVKGKVNIHTSGEIPVEDVLPILETIFEVNNVAAVKMGDIYKVIPIKDAQKQFLIPKVGSKVTDESSPDRIILQIVPLRYISSTEMDKIIKRFVGKGGDSIDYADRNTLIIVDTADNVRKLLGLIDSVDVSIFDSMHVQFYELKEAEAVDLAKELEELFAAIGIDPKKKKGGEIVSFIPIDRMNIILAVSTSPDAFDIISEWVRKLDGTRQDIDEQIYIYFVENAKAVDIADIVKELYGEERSAREKKTTSRKTTSRDKDQKTKTPAASKTAAAKSSSITGTKGEVTIVVDETNNAIVIRALPQDYVKILKTIKMLDIVPRQVLIEVLIAEVGLDANTEFGMEWTVFDDYASLGGYKGVDRLGQNFNLGGLGQDLSKPLTQTGFTYAFASNALEAFLRAYSRENKVNILSTPHILAADNTEASIDVGQEVPIVTSEYTPTTLQTATESYSRSIEYRDTGILLTVTPRINDKGLVALEVNQEVSDISEQRIEGINSPIILKRQAETSLVVQDGRTIVIGGLIREKTDETQEGLPILSKIPYLGMLFGYNKNTTNKVELLILITPHVVKSFEEAELATREFTEKVKSLQKLLKK
jgi:general secretion pathway protein D